MKAYSCGSPFRLTENIGPQLVSGNFPASRTLNGDALLGCNRPMAVDPLPDKAGSHAELARKFGLRNVVALEIGSEHEARLKPLSANVNSHANRRTVVDSELAPLYIHPIS